MSCIKSPYKLDYYHRYLKLKSQSICESNGNLKICIVCFLQNRRKFFVFCCVTIWFFVACDYRALLSCIWKTIDNTIENWINFINDVATNIHKHAHTYAYNLIYILKFSLTFFLCLLRLNFKLIFRTKKFDWITTTTTTNMYWSNTFMVEKFSSSTK